MTNPVTPKRKVGRPKGSRPAERSLKAFKLQEVLNLSERHLLRILKGETNLSLKEVTQVALELYKRRVPTSVENDGKQGQLTLIKIIKNHVPVKQVDTLDITTDAIENATDEALRRFDE